MKEAYLVEIESIDLDGRGVARRDGKVVFVEGAAPGERVRVHPLKVKRSYETARVAAVERASNLRVAPRCPHFGLHAGACGGCSMQHLDGRAQLAVKQRALEDTLWHVGRLRAEVVLRPVSGPPWHYRNRARLAVRNVVKKGGVLVGFHERASSYVADMRVCPVLPAHVGAMLLALRELVGMLSLRARLPQIEVATSGAGEDSVTVLVMRVLDPPTEGDMSRLRAFAAAHRVSIWLQPGGPSTAAPLDPTETSRLTLALPEFDVEIPFLPTEFTQVNHRMNEVLVRRAVHLLAPQPDDHVVDFFCGLGNFSLALARRAASVVGIEGSAALVARAEQAATRNALAGRARFFVRNLFEWTEDDFERLAAERGAPQRVLIDPPREGALCVARSLVRLRNGPRRVVYVSCNPATLARDCAVLVHEGAWRLRGAGVVDMFPHTSHVESIAVLEPGPGR